LAVSAGADSADDVRSELLDLGSQFELLEPVTRQRFPAE
jgi:hypothetical protein